ncbi:MAG: response regulator [Candidatus Omnitrophota bacterium]|nr:response regulator [Candidatus Omnitrophota bacterium]
MAKKKILVVDDEIDFTELMKLRLEASGYDVIILNSGEDALNTVKTDKPDAVLLDIMMPGTDGIAVLKQIRALDAKLPVFMVTAFSNEERIKLAGKLNATGFIVKSRQDISEEIKNITRAIEIADKYREKRG